MESKLNSNLDKNLFFKSVRQVVSAVTSVPGADCVLYAAVGAGLLSDLGYRAMAVAGSAAWRVGEGDPDVISHASEISGPVFGSSASQMKMAGLFHAWIRVEGPDGGEIVDLTTWQLKKKGRELDLADGGVTNVEFCPDFLWESEKSSKLLPITDVVQSYDSGVYGYLRKPFIEAVIFSEGIIDEAQRLIAAARMCYHSGLRGEAVQVIGFDENGPSEANDDAPMRLRQMKPR